jgi:hypothetical protein
MLRASITRLGGTYSATLHTEEGVWLLHGAPGEPSTAWCVPDENEVESDVEAAQTTLVEVGPDDGTCGNGDVPVIDVLAVYTDAARVAAGGSATNPNDDVDARTDIANSLANVQDALASSLVDARLRVVGIHQIPDEPSGPSCTARSALVTASGTSGTVLKGLVDTLQPDVVMGYMPSYSGADTGCSPTTNWKVLSTGWIESEPDATVVAVSEKHAWQTGARHELGHAFGLCHNPEKSCSAGADVPDFAFGFVTRYGDDPDRRYSDSHWTRSSAAHGTLRAA